MDKLRLAQELDALSQKMISVGECMTQHEGELYQRHGGELQNAGCMVAMWHLAVMEEANGDE